MSRIPNTAHSRKHRTYSALVEGSPAFLATFFCDLDGRNSVARQRMVYSGQQVSEWLGLYTYLETGSESTVHRDNTINIHSKNFSNPRFQNSNECVGFEEHYATPTLTFFVKGTNQDFQRFRMKKV
jgi:hypothetical protein